MMAMLEKRFADQHAKVVVRRNDEMKMWIDKDYLENERSSSRIRKESRNT